MNRSVWAGRSMERPWESIYLCCQANYVFSTKVANRWPPNFIISTIIIKIVSFLPVLLLRETTRCLRGQLRTLPCRWFCRLCMISLLSLTFLGKSLFGKRIPCLFDEIFLILWILMRLSEGRKMNGAKDAASVISSFSSILSAVFSKILPR